MALLLTARVAGPRSSGASRRGFERTLAGGSGSKSSHSHHPPQQHLLWNNNPAPFSTLSASTVRRKGSEGSNNTATMAASALAAALAAGAVYNHHGVSSSPDLCLTATQCSSSSVLDTDDPAPTYQQQQPFATMSAFANANGGAFADSPPHETFAPLYPTSSARSAKKPGEPYDVSCSILFGRATR